MKLLKDPETDILYCPIDPNYYSWLYQPRGPRLGTFYTFEVNRKDGGYSILQNNNGPDNLKNQKNYFVDDKPIFKNWIKINGIWGNDLFYGQRKKWPKWYAYLCHVDLDSIKQSVKINREQKERFKDTVDISYLKPKYDLDKETEEDWGEIIANL